jgi:hypothetical protein
MFVGMDASWCSWSLPGPRVQLTIYLIIGIFSWSLLNELAICLRLDSRFVLLTYDRVLQVLFSLVLDGLLLAQSEALIAWTIPCCVLGQGYCRIW